MGDDGAGSSSERSAEPLEQRLAQLQVDPEAEPLDGPNLCSDHSPVPALKVPPLSLKPPAAASTPTEGKRGLLSMLSSRKARDSSPRRDPNRTTKEQHC